MSQVIIQTAIRAVKAVRQAIVVARAAAASGSRNEPVSMGP